MPLTLAIHKKRVATNKKNSFLCYERLNGTFIFARQSELKCHNFKCNGDGWLVSGDINCIEWRYKLAKKE